MKTSQQKFTLFVKSNQTHYNFHPGCTVENSINKNDLTRSINVRLKNTNNALLIGASPQEMQPVNFRPQQSREEPKYSNQDSPNSREQSSLTGLGYSSFSTESSEELDLGSSAVEPRDPFGQGARVDDHATEKSAIVSRREFRSDEEQVSKTIVTSENVGNVGDNENSTGTTPTDHFKDITDRVNSRSFAIGQRVKQAWLMAKKTLKNESCQEPKNCECSYQSPLSQTGSTTVPNKGDQLGTYRWPPTVPLSVASRSRSSEDVPINASYILLGNHTETLIKSLKDATLKLAHRDMEMQRLLSVNRQLGERYCQMRNQYTELAREQARLRQRYDMLVVKGMDREQLRLCNSRLETQLSEVQAQLAKAEERANQSTRRLGRVEAEAKDIAQSVTSADMQLANLKVELQRKEAQIAALTSRQYINATREMQARAILNELIEMRGNIRVLLRCRENPEEESMFRFLGDDTLALRTPRKTSTLRRQTNQLFKVHRVFQPGTAQRAVFDELKDVISSCVDGYGVSIITYGQTGTGKTYTMLGAPKKPGIIPRAARHLLVQCTNRAPLWTYRLSVAVVQVYKETIIDLLGDPIQPTNIHQLGRVNLHDNGRQILLRGAKEIEVHTEEEILETIRKARVRRQISAHLLNTSPSYLHFIVILRVRGACLLTTHALDLYEMIRKQSKVTLNGSRFHPHFQEGLHPIAPPKMDNISGSCGGDEDFTQAHLITHGLLMLCDLAGFDSWNPSQTLLPPVTAQPVPSPKLQSHPNALDYSTPSQPTKHMTEPKPISAMEPKLSSDLDSDHPFTTATNANVTPVTGLVVHGVGQNKMDSQTVENKHLGRSLITLSRVIDALVESEGNAKFHIPYRDAKLTHLLKPCLTGDAKCMLIITLNTQRACLDASLRSLKLASKASQIALGQAKKNATLRGGIRTFM